MLPTEENLQKMTGKNGEAPFHCDLLVVGGGINGAGIARDAAGRGLSVVLCEKDDWGSATSSASTKLIHGGLRYLEQYEFSLVRASLIERDILARIAPHLISPMRFVLPHDKSLRPKWMIRAGLFLYDRLGGWRRESVFEKSYRLSLQDHPLHEAYKTGFVYSDGWVDDARLVLCNVAGAQEKGAVTLSRTECRRLEADEKTGLWTAALYHKAPDAMRGRNIQITARCVVNAAGPWVDSFLPKAVEGFKARHAIRLVKGSHIVVPRLYKGDHAYILQNDDGRIVFAIPYQNAFTLIGTTDESFTGDPAAAKISEDEKRYLCSAVSRYFTSKIDEKDIVWSYSGVRPLLEDGKENASKVTRDYRLDFARHHSCPILSVYGGKLTTYRKLSERALEKIKAEVFPDCGGAWTENAVLPGGDFSPAANFEALLKTLLSEYHWLSRGDAERFLRRYGAHTWDLLKNCHHQEDMGQAFGGGLTAHEIDYLVEREDVQAAADILWRRTKSGLHCSPAQRQDIEDYVQQRKAKK